LALGRPWLLGILTPEGLILVEGALRHASAPVFRPFGGALAIKGN
jgi:hypothetical protein